MIKLIYCLVFIILFFNSFHSQQDIKSVKKEIFCYDFKEECIFQESFILAVDSIHKIDSTFFSRRNYYIIIEVNGRYNELHLLISNGMKNFSILDSDLSKVDSLSCQKGISKYWSFEIKENWKKTIKSINGKWCDYDDAPESIGLIIKKRGKKYRVKGYFGG